MQKLVLIGLVLGVMLSSCYKKYDCDEYLEYKKDKFVKEEVWGDKDDDADDEDQTTWEEAKDFHEEYCDPRPTKKDEDK